MPFAAFLERARSNPLAPVLAGALDGLLGVVFPPLCPLCGAPLVAREGCARHRLPEGPPGARCGRCAAALPSGLPHGRRCALCARRSPGVALTVALGDYARDPGLRAWVLALKHGGRRDLAPSLGEALARLVARTAPPAPGAALVPVPLHPGRRLERGHDQALLVARAAGAELGRPAVRALRRVRATPPQGAPGASSRDANLRGALAPRRGARRRLGGREVWLVDDVATSGATLREAARAVRGAGAARVCAMVLLRA